MSTCVGTLIFPKCDTKACIIHMQDIWTGRKIKMICKINNQWGKLSFFYSKMGLKLIQIISNMPLLLEKWKHTWGISVVQRKRLLLLYFCPVKLFSSLPSCVRHCKCEVCAWIFMYVWAGVCVYLRSCASGHIQLCVLICPFPEQPCVAFLIAYIYSCVDFLHLSLSRKVIEHYGLIETLKE